MMRIELLAGHYTRMIGLARYTVSIQKYLSRIGADYSVIYPVYPLPVKVAHQLLRPLGYDVKSFFTIFPLAAPLHQHTIHHFTTQMMGSLFSFQRHLSPVVVTVHDIVPYLTRSDPEQYHYRRAFDARVDQLAMENLRKADLLIAISSYTRDMLVQHLACPSDKIRVILYGVDHDIFKTVPVSEDLRYRYGLENGFRYLLYVGSENPRKNLSRLLEALARVKRHIPNIRLLKVGTPEYLSHYQKLKQQIVNLGLEETVIFINHPPQEDLVGLYNVADLFVFPSLYEGFGMPPLEAMACGTPVVCSNAASLPEVVGQAALTFDPTDVEEMENCIVSVLTDPVLAQCLRERGLERAAKFTWENTARETYRVYEELSHSAAWNG